ncbi:glutathione peroxidase gpx1 [Modicella reniformis]|uniref:Glutathione peroxidase n=1 Tax=Modicella reniformis TaxID=1440133 RepID=A0A9P6LTZ3_9FUNG|nr:glutathione peroxidase gpx1 [Modicella reniformis]
MSFSYQSTQNASLSPWALRSFSTAARTASAAAHGVVSTNFFDLKAKDKHHQEVNLSDFKGKVVLVVNVASKCGFTDQYKGLEELYKNYKDKGFVIIGFPCNQFGGQIESFSQVNYGITFPLMDKIDVNGNKEDSVYTFLKSQKTGVMGLSRIKWNFEKFLIARDGTVFQRYSPVTIPSEMIQDIEKLLSPA